MDSGNLNCSNVLDDSELSPRLGPKLHCLALTFTVSLSRLFHAETHSQSPHTCHKVILFLHRNSGVKAYFKLKCRSVMVWRSVWEDGKSSFNNLFVRRNPVSKPRCAIGEFS